MPSQRALERLQDHNRSPERNKRSSRSSHDVESSKRRRDSDRPTSSRNRSRSPERERRSHKSRSKSRNKSPRARRDRRERDAVERDTEQPADRPIVVDEVSARSSSGRDTDSRKRSKSKQRCRSVSRSVSRSPAGKRRRSKSPIRPSGRRATSDGDNDANPPRWAKYFLDSQLICEERLVSLEHELKKVSGNKNAIDDAKTKFVFEKKIYSNQHDFNMNIFEHLNRALELVGDDTEASNELRKGIDLINSRNKQLKIADRWGWETAECYELDPIADDSSDEKRLKRAKKEGKQVREEKAKVAQKKKNHARRKPGPFRPSQFNASGYSAPAQQISCWRCRRSGHVARFCRAPIPNNQFNGFRPPSAVVPIPPQINPVSG